MSIVLFECLWFSGQWGCCHGQTKTIHIRRVMGKDYTVITSGEARKARWSTSLQQSRSLGRHIMGSQDGSPLGRSSAGIPKFDNLLATPGNVGRARDLAEHLANISWIPGRKASSGLERVLCRREFLSRQKRGLCVGPTKKGKGTKWMVATDGKGIPVALHFESASRAEIKLLETTLANVRVPKKGPGRPKNKPQRVIADRGYDSDPHRRRFRARGIDLIVPYRSSSKNRTFEDGRKLRRYRKRYKVERSISWFGNYRRLLNRFEHNLLSFSAFFHVACIMIVSRWF